MTKKTKRAFAMLCAIAMIFTVASTAFATDDPLQVINNLSEFIFGLIRHRHDTSGIRHCSNWSEP